MILILYKMYLFCTYLTLCLLKYFISNDDDVCVPYIPNRKDSANIELLSQYEKSYSYAMPN